MLASTGVRAAAESAVRAASTYSGNECMTKFKKINKLLVANRGEIAVRIFRGAKEMGIRTVAIYSKEDINQMHRQKADEAYLVGAKMNPLDAYLSIPEIIRVCKENNVDAVHPGYGFLSERADFAQAVVDAGITWVGPCPKVVDDMGNKNHAKLLAKSCNVPVVPGTDGPVADFAEAKAFCEKIGFPVMLKATFGGGGRGMRIVRKMEELQESYERCTSEAKAAFGDGSVFIERYVEFPRHIEVQVLGDYTGNIIHLFERDCSIQRRHQKVIEVAPAPSLDEKLRADITAAAVKLCKQCNYTNAGTVEFLVDPQGRFYFMEVNARLQVEHTVTEEITGVDLVQAQISIAQGKSLKEMNLDQPQIKKMGAAIQCRVTTEDPLANFRPDTGRINVFRSAEGCGIRLDGGPGFAGAVITPHYDSLLVKVTSRARTHGDACKKLIRALTEMRIRGLKTNIPFLLNVLAHPVFLEGRHNTSFIEKYTKEVFDLSKQDQQDETVKLRHYLATVAVNGPQTPLGTSIAPQRIKVPAPEFTPSGKKEKSLRSVFVEQGPAAFAKAVRAKDGLMICDTTLRDGHQSLLATRMRNYDMFKVAPYMNQALRNAYSLEMWGGATFDVCLRFLRECPWDRVSALREMIPDVPFQMLLRGTNAVGYTSYADNVIFKFVDLAKKTGIDVFRIFDSLNYVPNLYMGMEAVQKAGGVVEAAMCYTGDVLKSKKYNLDYYLKLGEQLVNAGTHVLAIKDMAGLIKPRGAYALISALRKEFPNVPIHLHTHDTAGAGVAACIAAADAGADVVDVAIDAMSGLTSQPSMGAVVAALEGSEHDTGIAMSDIAQLSNYWELVRSMYGPFEATATMKSSTSDVYSHEIPGGQYTNLHFQAFSLGLADQWPTIKKAYCVANDILGDVIKVTPSSKVVGDLAQFMTQNKLMDEKSLIAKADDLSFPNSVIDFFQGGIGQPYGGFVEPLRTKVLKGAKCYEARPGAAIPPVDLEKLRADLQERFPSEKIRDVDVMSAALYPQVFNEYVEFKQKFGPVSLLPTPNYFVPTPLGEEVQVNIRRGFDATFKIKAIGDVNKVTGDREVFTEYNGEPRVNYVADTKILKGIVRRPKADKSNKGSIGAPMPGEVVKISVEKGKKVVKGTPLCVLSAMKMETVVQSPIAGEIVEIAVKAKDTVEAGDLLITIKA